ncbi:auxin efflux carrier [Artemisia annua]|uniref:Auxin efflux carrier n=1 Tax=Artemisia annua TaxID=35608 RepID=A0A2U1Q8V2_ARTAN|nr:auxin efflux carrier [Artemisia annua]
MATDYFNILSSDTRKSLNKYFRGNLGKILLIIVPAICTEGGSPFGEHSVSLIRHSPWCDDTQIQGLVSKDVKKGSFSSKVVDILHTVLEELLAPPTLGSVLVLGATPWLKNLVIGDNGPLRVIQDSVTLLGDGTIPCITLILGGNVIQGLRRASIKPVIIITMIFVRFVILPMIRILVIKPATSLGLLPSDPLFSFVLLIQYTVSPAMNISKQFLLCSEITNATHVILIFWYTGTMTQLFNVGQEECSVLTMWCYLVAAIALTGWSTIKDPIHVHIKSEDDDLGDHILAFNQNENWGFCENVWRTTMFYADFKWNGKTALFGVFDKNVVKHCTKFSFRKPRVCVWIVRDDGFYVGRGRAPFTDGYTKMHDWS